MAKRLHKATDAAYAERVERNSPEAMRWVEKQVILQTLAGRSRLGAASAVVSMARALGSTLGTALFGARAAGRDNQDH